MARTIFTVNVAGPVTGESATLLTSAKIQAWQTCARYLPRSACLRVGIVILLSRRGN